MFICDKFKITHDCCSSESSRWKKLCRTAGRCSFYEKKHFILARAMPLLIMSLMFLHAYEYFSTEEEPLCPNIQKTQTYLEKPKFTQHLNIFLKSLLTLAWLNTHCNCGPTLMVLPRSFISFLLAWPKEKPWLRVCPSAHWKSELSWISPLPADKTQLSVIFSHYLSW